MVSSAWGGVGMHTLAIEIARHHSDALGQQNFLAFKATKARFVVYLVVVLHQLHRIHAFLQGEGSTLSVFVCVYLANTAFRGTSELGLTHETHHDDIWSPLRCVCTDAENFPIKSGRNAIPDILFYRSLMRKMSAKFSRETRPASHPPKRLD
eukprot:1334030-Amorphochlora_amoeboformis.AAC.1